MCVCVCVCVYVHVLVCVIKYVNLYILFCTILLNYPLRSTMSEYGYATLWDMGQNNGGSVPYMSVLIYKYIENKIIENTLRVFFTLSYHLWACDPN